MLPTESAMAFTRRAMVKTLGLGGAALFGARREAWAELLEGGATSLPVRPLLLHNNENPLGPGPAAFTFGKLFPPPGSQETAASSIDTPCPAV